MKWTSYGNSHVLRDAKGEFKGRIVRERGMWTAYDQHDTPLGTRAEISKAKELLGIWQSPNRGKLN